jgi:hypothetical protein
MAQRHVSSQQQKIPDPPSGTTTVRVGPSAHRTIRSATPTWQESADGRHRTLPVAWQVPDSTLPSRPACALSGSDEMVIRGRTDAPIPWPLGSPKGRGGRPSLIVYKGLAKAVRQECEQAICHWFAACPFTVWKWRKALSVERGTPGTVSFHSLPHPLQRYFVSSIASCSAVASICFRVRNV